LKKVQVTIQSTRPSSGNADYEKGARRDGQRDAGVGSGDCGRLRMSMKREPGWGVERSMGWVV
jgi:hypothetical protein